MFGLISLLITIIQKETLSAERRRKRDRSELELANDSGNSTPINLLAENSNDDNNVIPESVGKETHIKEEEDQGMYLLYVIFYRNIEIEIEIDIDIDIPLHIDIDIQIDIVSLV